MSNSTVGVGADDLVTGEAVALELPAAGIAIRALSGFLDLLVAGAALWIGLFVSSAMTENADKAIIGIAMTLLLVVVTVVLPTTLETLTRGRSVGKLVTGLRTVRDDAGPIGFRHALTRALVGFVEIWALVGVPALVSAIVSNKGKRLGDYAAGTYVVREQVHITLPPPPMMPPQPMQLHDEVVAYVSPLPPFGIHPEVVLAAVIADRRRRDTIRLERDAALRRRLIPADPIDSLP
jgi:uncharacterized RDD family membrane protein YckC